LGITNEPLISADAHGAGSATERDRILVNGERVPSAGADVPEVINPVTGEPVTTIPAGTAADAGLAWAGPSSTCFQGAFVAESRFQPAEAIHDRAAADLYQRRMGGSLK
jgi:acyl-CoA reductase-like NAD-dependent aldehyde dehydrogenase